MISSHGTMITVKYVPPQGEILNMKQVKGNLLTSQFCILLHSHDMYVVHGFSCVLLDRVKHVAFY